MATFRPNLCIIIATDVHIKLTLKATTITSTKMLFTEEDKHLIKFLVESKGYGSRRFLKLFLNRGWSMSGLDKLLRKIDATGSIERLPGSGRRRTARTVENIEAVEALMLSQEDMP